ncbi:MAG: fumarylacetoacetate hydrolase family protein, partial [Nocardioidaceae bacterium]
MRLATARIEGSTRAVKVEGDTLVDLGYVDLGDLLAQPDWKAQAAAATGPTRPAAGVAFAPLVPRPSKVVCVGLNYKNHIQ